MVAHTQQISDLGTGFFKRGRILDFKNMKRIYCTFQLWRQPLTILQGRIFRAALQMKF